MLKFINLCALAIYCAFIYWLSSKHSIPTPKLFPHQDKVFHLGAYFIMGALAWRFFRNYWSKNTIIMSCSVLFCLFYGMTDEWHQSFVPGRDADWKDLVADTMGAIIAMGFISFVNRKIIRFKILEKIFS